MATSSGDDLPRNLEFLFSRNRLNVAISRAQSLAVLVASPQLLEIRCRTIEQMRMVNALCRFVEDAEGSLRESPRGLRQNVRQPVFSSLGHGLISLPALCVSPRPS